MSRGFASNYRIVLLSGAILLSFAALGSRLVTLHVTDREKLLGSITKARNQVIEDRAQRGDILDRNGAILATSHSIIVLGVDPRAVDEKEFVDEKQRAKWLQLAELTGLSEAEIRRISTTKYKTIAPKTGGSAADSTAQPAGLVLNLKPLVEEVAPAAPAANDDEDDDATKSTPDDEGRRLIGWAKLSDDISESTYAQIEKLGLKSVYGRREYRRVYPNRQLAAHVLGYVNRQGQAVAGMESYADFYLRGQDGWRVGEKDGRRRELAQFRTREILRTDGDNVSLSIDTRVQDIVEQELEKIGRTYQPLKATIIVSDPHTGFILGMGNYPTFDPNTYNKLSKEEMGRMRNIAVADIYEPGSVFKIVAVAAGLEEHVIRQEDTFDTATPTIDYRVGSKVYTLRLPPEDHRFENPSAVSVAHIVSYSSNRGAARIAMKVGDEKFHSYVEAFGFGRKLGFPVGGEVPGILNSLKYWRTSPLDFTRVPMGHAVSVTPLQMHQAMSVIASGGVLLKPQIIREIRDASNEVVYRYDRVEIGRAISPATAQTMARLLMGVASKEGTAPEAAIPGYEVAGKTGTAQKYIDGKPSERHHVVSFVGFFPASQPQVAISVVVDDADAHAPNGVAYGSKVAAPSFKSIGEKLIPILDIKPAVAAAHLPLVAVNEGGRR